MYIRDSVSENAVQAAGDLPTERARNGQPTLTFKGVRLHSSVNPLSEANDLMEEFRGALDGVLDAHDRQTVVCVLAGPGLGYLLNSLFRYAAECGSDARLQIVCCETEPEIARKALQLQCWGECSLPVRWVVGRQNAEALKLAVGDAPHIVFTGTAAYRQNREDYESILGRITGIGAAERPLRILVPTPLYGGSFPMAKHCADAFRELGHQVEEMDLSPYYPLFRYTEETTSDVRHTRVLQNLLTTFLAEMIAARALDWRADLVWAVAQTPLTPAALQEMRHEGIHSALWFVEDYRLFNYWRELAPHYDAVFTIQRGEFHDALKAIGVKNVRYMPCAANPKVHKPLALTPEETKRFGSDVSFVGAGYLNRQQLFAQLPFPDFKIWGNDWPESSPVASRLQENGRRVTTEETAQIYGASKINLNLHSSSFHNGINPDGDFVNPRTFEIAACGAFQLVDDRAELCELFEPGRELTVFHNENEIPDLAKYYLEHEDERKETAELARKRVLEQHTYLHRMRDAVTFCELRFRRLAERKRGPNYVSSLKRAAGDDAELVEFLSAFPEDEEITLDQIVSRIKLGNGRLTRPEGLFLLMKEFRDWGREKGVIQ